MRSLRFTIQLAATALMTSMVAAQNTDPAATTRTTTQQNRPLQNAQPGSQPVLTDKTPAPPRALPPAGQRIETQIMVGPNQFEVQILEFDPDTLQWIPVPPEPPALPTAEELADEMISPQVMQLVHQLGGEGFDRREQAEQDLLASGCTTRQLYAVLTRNELSAEQRCRLLSVVSRSLIYAPRGAMGISMQWRPGADAAQPGEVEVINLLPGLPARELLRLGDRISHIDGQPLATQNDLIRIVQNKKPGEVVKLTIRRPRFDDMGDPVVIDGKPVLESLVIDLPLGSADRLAEFGMQTFSPVLSERQREARHAAERFAAPTRTVAVPQRPGGSSRSLTSAADIAVEGHAMIRRLQGDLASISRGASTLTPELRQRWETELNALAQAVEQPGISAEERAFRKRLSHRYAELLPR